ncbi:hypothetical protein IFM89_020617 [Coptis chinensis]|uniref:SUF system FeS cluster assembly SufBD core domain-containing protein n=1 Tax=Coptis chinensis TaxID=261450 RepID=A0A835IDV8_9MAGN|nr:hypothetical protein IFM89_020617 [Coptis chinensis]
MCLMLIQTYFRINDMETGQFERTLIVDDEGTEGTEIKYSTVQNWYAGDEIKYSTVQNCRLRLRLGLPLLRSTQVLFWKAIMQWAKNPASRIEHEASTSKVNEDQLFYFLQRGNGHDKAVKALISGFCQEVLETLPLEVRAKLQENTGIKLDRSVG